MRELLSKLERDPESHKGENGKVGVIGGSVDYTGAPALSAKAALRTGCDLVKILTSESVKNVVAIYSENFIVESYSKDYFSMEDVEQALKLDEWADAVVIGPGLGDPEAKAVREFLQESSSAKVIDADALEHVEPEKLENAVLTPHAGEFEAIEEDLDQLVENGNVIVKKGVTDTIYGQEGETAVEVGHPAMTVGGTGDVLTGVIASLIAQDLSLEESAKLGFWINGKAGERAAEEYGNGAVATDVIEEIPAIISREI